MFKRSALLPILILLFSVSIPIEAMEEEVPLALKRKPKRQPQPEVKQPSGKEAEEVLHSFHKRKMQRKALTYGSATAVTVAALAATAYAGLKLWQTKKINEVLARYGKSLRALAPKQAMLMIAAYKKDRDAMRAYGTVDVLRDAWVVPAMTELYFKGEPTEARIEQLKLKVIGTGMQVEKF